MCMTTFIYQEFAPVCARPLCNNTTKDIRKGVWRTYCSAKCSARSPLKQQKIKETNLEKYGVENPKQSAEINQKILNTMVERHGVPYAEQSTELSEKRKNTLKTRYGVDSNWQMDSVKLQSAETMLEKYGVTNAAKSANLQENLLRGQRYLVPPF